MELKKRYGVDSQKRGIFTIFGLFFVNYFRRGNAVYMKLNNVHRIQGNEIKLGSHKLRWNTKLFTAVHHRTIYCSHSLAHKILFCLNYYCKMTAIVFFVVHGGENISKSFFKISKDKTQSVQKNRRICIQLM